MIDILAVIVGLGSLVCWIMILIKLFNDEGALKGILGIICGIYAFIWGWQKAGVHNHKNVMIAWSICLVLGIIFNVMMQ